MRKALLIILAVLMVSCLFVSCNTEPKTATITFNPGDAEGDVYKQEILCGVETELDKNKFEYPGFQFVGWAKTSGGEVVYKDLDKIVLNSNITLYAVWTQIYNIEVAKDVTGGKMEAKETSYVVSDSPQVIALKATPDDNYYFAGVSTEGSENKDAFSVLGTLLIPQNSKGNIKLTPVFRAKTEYVVITFNPGDTTGNPYTQELEYNVEAALTANKFTKEGYKFIGWSMSPTGGNDYKDKEKITPTMDLNLYAVWSKLYDIEIKTAEGGKIESTVSQYIESDNAQIIQLTATPDADHVFKGIKLDGSENKSVMYFVMRLLIQENSTGKIVITPVFTEKPSSVEYVDAKWEDSKVKTETKTVDSAHYSLVSRSVTSWSEGWRVVAEDIEMEGRVSVSGNVNLILCDGVTLKAAKGITVPEGATLTIYGQTNQTGKLFINDVDKGFAGIGGSGATDFGKVEIKGGDLEIHGGELGAGIGSGSEKKPGTITILNGNLKAYGGWNSGAAIGGGLKSDGGVITIYGGTIHAEGGNDGSGIGGGDEGAGGTISIYGGTINTRGGMNNNHGGAGIGGGRIGNGGKISIYGGNIEAYGGDYSAGIGSGHGSGHDGQNGGEILISGGSVKAEGNRGAAGIGGAYGSSGADVTINGGTIDVKGGDGMIDIDYSPHMDAIGKGWFHSADDGSNKSLKLGNGVKLEAQSYEDGAKWKDWKEGDSRQYRMRTKK